jgi:hypothetical protein
MEYRLFTIVLVRYNYGYYNRFNTVLVLVLVLVQNPSQIFYNVSGMLILNTKSLRIRTKKLSLSLSLSK